MYKEKELKRYCIDVHMMYKIGCNVSVCGAVWEKVKNMRIEEIKISYSILPRLNTRAVEAKNKLYIYNMLLGKVTYGNRGSKYDKYKIYIKWDGDISRWDMLDIFHWNRYYKKLYVDMYGKEIVRAFKVKYKDMGSIEKVSVYKYIKELKNRMIYITVKMNIDNINLKKLWLSHRYISV